MFYSIAFAVLIVSRPTSYRMQTMIGTVFGMSFLVVCNLINLVPIVFSLGVGIVIYRYISRSVVETCNESIVAKSDTNSLLVSFIDGFLTIRAMNKRRYIAQKFFTVLDRFSNAHFMYYSLLMTTVVYISVAASVFIQGSFFVTAFYRTSAYDYQIPIIFFAGTGTILVSTKPITFW